MHLLDPHVYYPWNHHPKSRLEEEHILHTYLCLDDYFQDLQVSEKLLGRARRIAAWLDATMLEYGERFKLVNANVYYTGDCPGWFHPILGSVKRENGLKGERVLTLALLVMLEHLAGDQIFREFWRCTRLWEADHKSFKCHEHHAFAENCLSGLSLKHAHNKAGVYIQLSPVYNSLLGSNNEGNFRYEGVDAAQKAARLGRRLVIVGQTMNSGRRDQKYLQAGTNSLHTAARTVTHDKTTHDVFQYFTRELVIDIPLYTKKGRPISALFRQLYESLLNFGCGATYRHGSTIWGRQTTAIDHATRVSSLDPDGVRNFLQWYAGRLQADAEAKREGFCWNDLNSGKHAVWLEIEGKVQELAATFYNITFQGIPAIHRPAAPPKPTRETIRNILEQSTSRLPFDELPMLPLTHWGHTRFIPKHWSLKYTRDGLDVYDFEKELANREKFKELRDPEEKVKQDRKNATAERERKRRAQEGEHNPPVSSFPTGHIQLKEPIEVSQTVRNIRKRFR